MADENHDRVSRIFQAVVDLDEKERSCALEELCAGDPEVRDTVERLLDEDARAGGFLERPALGTSFGLKPSSEPGTPISTVTHSERIGHFKILEVLGEGGMGVVYLAEQESPHRTVALKVIRAGLTSTRMLRRFEHEAEVLARLHHPGIAQIYEAGTADTGLGVQPFFAMEYIQGPSLTSYVQSANLGVRERLQLIQQVCDAVQHAHQNGVIHRDLKPGNIVVDESGHPRILDFGVARAIDSDLATTTLRTLAGQLVGTVPYMSPEQTLGVAAQLDTRSDVYTLGVLTFELLAGRLPYDFGDKPIPEILPLIRDVDPIPLGSIDRTLRGDLETITAKALEKDPERRYQSASDLAADIGRFLRNEPIMARPPSRMYLVRQFARRNRGAVVGAAFVLLALILGTAATTWQAFNATEQRNRAAAAEARAQKRFDQVRALANTFIFDIHDKIVELPGSTEARKLLLDTAVNYLDSLAVDAKDDPALQREIAEGYLRVGRVLGNTGSANLGDTAGALASFRKALTIDQALAGQAPRDQAALDLAESHQKVAQMLQVTGDLAGALEEYKATLELARSVAAVDPSSMQALRLCAGTLVQLSAVQMLGGRMDEALQFAQESVVASEAVCTADSSNDAQERLSRSYFQLGRVQEHVGQAGAALQSFESSTAIAQRLCDANPHHVSRLRFLCISHMSLGDLLNIVGRTEEALTHHGKALDVTLALLEADPNDWRARQDLGFSYERIGTSHSRQGDMTRALEAFQQGLDARAAVVEHDPNDAVAIQLLGISNIQVGDAHLDLGNHEQARQMYRTALGHAEGLVNQDPKDGYAMNLLISSLEGLSKVEIASADFEACERYARRMLQLADRQFASDPDDVEWTALRGSAHEFLGTSEQNRGNRDEALDHLQTALTIRLAWVDKDPESERAKLDLIKSYDALGDFYAVASEDPLNAAAQYREGIEMRLALAKSAAKPVPERLALLRKALAVGGRGVKSFEHRSVATTTQEAKQSLIVMTELTDTCRTAIADLESSP